MGIRKFIRKIIPNEIRDNPALAIVAVAVIGPAALGALGASTASIIGATVASNTAAAVAIGTGVVSAGVTYVQGGTVSDSLKAGVLSGAGSYAGSVVSNSVSNAVSNATGAPLGGGVGATVTPSGQFASTAGGTGFGAAGTTGFQTAANAGQILGVANPTFAGFLAGNVAGRSTEAAITGKPIEQAALFGAAQSIGFGLDRMPDFKALPKPVQDVLVSSAQAAVMGQDVGDAVIESIVKSTNVVGKALKEVPGGIEFTERNPVATRYIINTVSSALAAQLQGKEISDTVLESLVRTTASVLQQKFADRELSDEVNEANSDYTKLQQKEQEIVELNKRLENLNTKYQDAINQYNFVASTNDYFVWEVQHYAGLATSGTYNQEGSNYYAELSNNAYEKYKAFQDEFKDAQRRLRASGYDAELADINTRLAAASNEFDLLFSRIDSSVNQLTQNSANLFTDFETELGFQLAPLTAFQETNVTDQDVLSQISPVEPPVNALIKQPSTLMQQLATADAVLKTYYDAYQSFRNAAETTTDEAGKQQFLDAANQFFDIAQLRVDEIAAGSRIVAIERPTEVAQAPATPVEEEQAIFDLVQSQLPGMEEVAPTEVAEISPVAPPTELAQGPVEDQDLLNQIQEVAARPDVGVPTDATELAQATAPTQIDISGVGRTERFRQGTQSIFEYPDGRLIVFDDNNPDGREISYAEYQDITGSPYRPIGGLQIDITTGEGISESQVGAGTGTPGAPAIDLGAQAPVEVVDPAYTVGFDLRTYGPGSPLSPNLAVFEIGGGRGTPGGSSTDTTFNLVSRDTVTGQETYDVGGKQYSLIVLPDKQVLVPTQPSEVVVYLERDPITDRPKMKEVPVTQVPQQDAVQIAAKVEETAGGAPTGAEGDAGGLTAERPSTTTPTEQLQPGVRPEEVAPGVSAEESAPSFPDLISGITEPTMPAPVPGAAAGFEDALQAPGAGGVGDEITDEDIIRIIQGEMGEAGGGEGEGLPGEEGAGPGEGEEGAGPGAGEEGEGEGANGEGEGTGEGVGPGTGEGEAPETQTPQQTADIVPMITTVGRRTFARPAEGAPYRVTGMDESGILGRKQPLFGGDEDLQRAEWNRRSLRLRRLLGL